MKSIKILAAFLCLMSLSLGTWSCGNASEASEGEATAAIQHGEGKEYNSAYVCPMHCEGSGSDEAGKCPECGMDYVALTDHVEKEHSH